MNNLHFHWEFVAFNDAPPSEDGKRMIKDEVMVTVLGWMSEGDASRAVQSVVAREGCLLRRVYECNTCGVQNRLTEAMEGLARSVK